MTSTNNPHSQLVYSGQRIIVLIFSLVKMGDVAHNLRGLFCAMSVST